MSRPSLPDAPAAYSQSQWRQIVAALANAVAGCFHKGEDVELARGERLILRSPNGARWAVKVDNAGAMGTTAL